MTNENDDSGMEVLDPLSVDVGATTPHGSIAYIDTVVVRVRYRPSDELVALLEANCLRTVDARPAQFFYWRIACQQPTEAALRILDSAISDLDGVLQRVDIALDIPCESREEAEQLRKWFGRHLDMPYARDPAYLFRSLEEREMPEWAGTETLYLQPRKWGRANVGAYSRDSKITGQPSLHIELRFGGSRAVRRIGGILRPSDLALLDPGSLIERKLRLARVDVRKLGKQVLGRGQAKLPLVSTYHGIMTDQEMRAGHLVVRNSWYAQNSRCLEEHDWTPPSPQAVRQYCSAFQWFNRRSACLSIDWFDIIDLPCRLTF
jgi:hypothetical protein